MAHYPTGGGVICHACQQPYAQGCLKTCKYYSPPQHTFTEAEMDAMDAAKKKRTGPVKVYGWIGHRTECRTTHRQTREIIAATSQQAAAKLVGVKTPRGLWNLGETGNGPEVQKAMSEPGVVFWRPLDDREAEWVRVPPRAE